MWFGFIVRDWNTPSAKVITVSGPLGHDEEKAGQEIAKLLVNPDDKERAFIFEPKEVFHDTEPKISDD